MVCNCRIVNTSLYPNLRLLLNPNISEIDSRMDDPRFNFEIGPLLQCCWQNNFKISDNKSGNVFEFWEKISNHALYFKP